MDMREIAARAAQAIEFHGHTKGDLVDAEGRLCLRGALQHAQLTKNPQDSSRMCWAVGNIDYPIISFNAHEIERKIEEVVGLIFTTAVEWNDNAYTTADDVIHALKRVANGEGSSG
jgi:hypothetical protein